METMWNIHKDRMIEFQEFKKHARFYNNYYPIEEETDIRKGVG